MRPYYFDFAQNGARRAKAIAMARPTAWHLSPPPRRDGPRTVLDQAVALIALWRKRICERRELATLDLRMQRDIGVTPSEVAAECSKPFWRA